MIEVTPTSTENLSIAELRLIDAVTDAALALEGAGAITAHLVKAEQFD